MKGTKELKKLFNQKKVLKNKVNFKTFLNEVLEGLKKDVEKNNGNLPYQAVSH
ncbi:MAG: hypothetical protein CM15mV128_270 [Caudoviricetes sp.]|nr:MAG: hypothetical protein CM15mV128_270 [Caudoviricetes sp.]